jgi:hypothetical protein
VKTAIVLPIGIFGAGSLRRLAANTAAHHAHGQIRVNNLRIEELVIYCMAWSKGTNTNVYEPWCRAENVRRYT